MWNDSIQLKKEKRKISHSPSCFLDYTDLDHFTFLFCRGCMVKKCRKICKAHAQLLFWSLKLLFGDILVVLVQLRSLVLTKPQLAYMQMQVLEKQTKDKCSQKVLEKQTIKEKCSQIVHIFFPEIFSCQQVNNTQVRN